MLVSIACILLFGILFGRLSEKFKIPSLFGMIIAGIIIGPFGLSFISQEINYLSPEIRKIALIVILTRAGLTLSLKDLKKAGISSFLLCFVPATLEIVGCILLAPIFLGIKRIDAAIMGAVLAAVSPAVVVPRMIKLIDEKYGTDKAIPQMVLTGASMDDIYVIILFTSFISLKLGGDISIKSIIIPLFSIVLGILVGVAIGYLYNLFFSKVKIDEMIEFMVIISITFLMIYFEGRLANKFDFASLVSVIVFANIISSKNENKKLDLVSKYAKLWSFAQIFLFVLVGATLDIRQLKYAGFSSIALILLILIFRFLGVLISLIPKNMDNKEKLFVMFAYTPKATVQAAIGGIALEKGVESGNIILTVAVLSILITAPIGAYLIDNSYKRLLKHEQTFEE